MTRRYHDDRYYRDYYPPSQPIPTSGGIKSRTTRGTFGQSWWARRWIEVLEKSDIGARLARGRSYARNGQVLGIEVEEGMVRAEVQGSRPRPYDVTIKVKTLTAIQWKKVAKSLARQPILIAKLLAGEMPSDIEAAFGTAGLSLFPERSRDLHTDCSCPDWSNPCKHSAAVCYLLGEEFDRDPFLIFTLRGMTRESLMALIESTTQVRVKGGAQAQMEAVNESESQSDQGCGKHSPADAFPTDVRLFWNGPGAEIEGKDGSGQVQIPVVAGSWVKRLGQFPFWRGEEDFLATMELIYLRASPAGMDLLATLGR